jgi:hypothetical protein
MVFPAHIHKCYTAMTWFSGISFTSHATDVLLWPYKCSVFRGLLCKCYFSETDELQGSSPWARTLGRIVANLPRGLGLTPPQDTEKKIKGDHWIRAVFYRGSTVYGVLWLTLDGTGLWQPQASFIVNPRPAVALQPFNIVPFRPQATARRAFHFHASFGL